MKVSIIVPAYNEEKTIDLTLKSLISQSYKDKEIIVVDNNSKDNTARLAKKLARVVNEKKQGYVFAVNRGVRETNGELLTICDADSAYPRDWLKRCVRAFKPGTVAVYGPARTYDGRWVINAASGPFTSLFLFVSKLMGLDNTCGYNFVIRREAFKRAGGYPADYKQMSPDVDLGRRLKKIGKVRLLPFNYVHSSYRRFHKAGFWKTIFLFGKAWWKMVLNRTPNVSYEEYNR